MRFRGLVVGTVTAALALSMTACGKSDTGTGTNPPVETAAKFEAGTTMEKLQKAGAVKVGTKFDQPLFGLKGLDGKPAGFDVEIAKLIASKLGISADKVEFIETPSKVREEVIEQGKVDFVVATYTINDKRKERISFAGPYYEAGQDLMVKKDDSAITGPDSLKGANAKVCSVTGSTPAEKIKTYVDAANIVLFDVYSKCADALRTGQVQAVTTDNVILLGLIDASKGEFKLVGKPFTKEPYGIGVKKADVKFCEFINKTLTDNAAAYEKAWKDTAGKVSPDTPKLPTTAACS
ncbi:Glutamate-binding protein of ABC transporter system [Alloactinosynnema sp. L-07]|uniref:glutamate ABC transporter substrate-binding protein n=1 Tax=Alloactinosynnema sp. L-07 TaxID=1653480 RepID=UPI00065F09B6|nr:glutamate ABC transporter substrate-binding protein [Alloactinosynnema sp. L-07]CRK55755.1 Glutamate-binding protein of ABC transporter system [Alloactinosynnema sp. L-07]